MLTKPRFGTRSSKMASRVAAAAFAITALWGGATIAAATQAVVVYATDSGILRRVTVLDNDSQIPEYQKAVGFGETAILVDAVGLSDATVAAAIEKQIGKPPPPPVRAILVENGMATAVLAIDPALDAVPAGSLVPNDKAGVGDTYDGTQFLREYAIVDKTTKKVVSIIPLPIDDPEASIDKATQIISTKGDLKVGDPVVIKGSVVAVPDEPAPLTPP